LVLFSIVDVFIFKIYSIYLITTTIIAIVAFSLERIIEIMQLTQNISPSLENIASNKAVFAYIDLYCEIERINRDLIKQLAGSQSGLLSQFDITKQTLNNISEHVNQYIQWQVAECKTLLEERNKLEQFFTDLNSQANLLCLAFAKYENKLNNSSGALHYCKESKTLVEDINVSFESRYRQTSNEFIKHIENIEQQLRKVVDRCSLFKEYMKPYSEKIDVYGYRMDSTIQSIQGTSNLKQKVLENMSNEIKESLKETNQKIEKTLDDVNQFYKKNNFVLSKILETYPTNITTNKKLKNILKSWPSLSPTEGIIK
jgi:methyl-accepting chemotaxis protein